MSEILKYPVKIGYPDSFNADTHVITKGSGNYITMTHRSGIVYKDHCTEDKAIQFIKEGVWIVISSGATESPPFTLTLDIYSDKLKHLSEAANKAVEALEAVKVAINNLEE